MNKSRKITALIVDDERLARKEMNQLLLEHPEIQVVGEASNADEAADMIDKLQPQLVFLDINMPEKNGFDLLESLDDVPKVVFTTAYDQYAIKAFDVNALDYLLKPVQSVRLAEAISKVSRQIQEEEIASSGEKLGEESQVFIKDGDKCFFVKLGDVSMFESVGNYVKVHFGTNRPLLHKSLNQLEDKLDPRVFFRANRQCIINLKFIEKIDPYFSNSLLVYLKGGQTIDVSRRQSIRFKELMSL